MLGVDLKTVGEVLGHKDIKMPMRYSHLSPEHKYSAVNNLPPHPECPVRKHGDEGIYN